MKVDLVMWSLHGARTGVLEQIDKVIPKEIINKKIVVVDLPSLSQLNGFKLRNFYDNGWTVLLNEGQGISEAANTALKQVTTDFFISFEEDLLLDPEWWNNIPKEFQNPKVAVSSGFRLPSKPPYIIKLQEYTLEKYKKKSSNTPFLYGKNLDNTMYRTAVIRELRGFPTLKVSAGVDNVLAKKIFEAGYIWKVNFDVRSIHLRRGFWDEVKHYWWYGKCYQELKKSLRNRSDNISSILLRTLFSPIRGVHIAWKKKSPLITFAYPLLRFTICLGILYSFVRRDKN